MAMSTELTLDCKIKITQYGDCTATALLPINSVPGIVLIEYMGNGWPDNHLDYVMLRYLDYMKIARPQRRLKRNPGILLPENIPANLRVLRYSARYMRHYWNGDWGVSSRDEFDWTLDPRRYLQRGEFAYFYVGYAGDDGYLRNLDGTIVSRKINCEFWESSYYTAELARMLRKHPQFSNVRFDQNVCYPNRSIVGSHYLYAKYEPLPGQLDDIATRPNVAYPLCDVGGSYGIIHSMPEVKKFKKPDHYEDPDDDDDWF